MGEKISKKTKIAYGFGNFGYSAVCQATSNFIMFFATAVLGLSGFVVGLCVAVASIWDALTDPFVGYLSDKAASKGKKRSSFLMLSTLLMVGFNMLVWLTPSFSSKSVSALWLFFNLICFETAETFYGTPYNALGYELSLSPHENTSLQNYKSVFNILGTIAPTVMLVIFTSSSDFSVTAANRASFAQIGMVCGALCIICTLITKLFVKEKSKLLPQKNNPSSGGIRVVLKNFFQIFSVASCRNIIIGYCCSMLATCLLTSIGLHVFTYSFHYNSLQIAILMGCLLVGSMISQILVYYTSKRLGKERALIRFLFIIILTVLVMLVFFYIRFLMSKVSMFVVLALLMACCGMGSGALYSLPSSIFCDIIQKNNILCGENRTATMSGAMSFAFKISNSLSLFGIGVVLDMIKFDGSSPIQPLFVQNSLGNVLLLGILLSITLAIHFFEKNN